MSHDTQQPPYIYEGLEAPKDGPSAFDQLTESVSGAVNHMRNAFDTARKPGMPLSVMSNVAREAPLASLLIAFLVGVAVARRR